MDRFIFDSYKILDTRKEIHFYYHSGADIFTEKIVLPKEIPIDVNQDLLHSFLFSLHLALGISYWKLRCFPDIIIKSGVLSHKQSTFWNKVYMKGLGEFFFRNKIEFKKEIIFPFSDTSPSSVISPRQKRQLVGIGGGKDSLVTWEMLKRKNTEVQGVVVQTQRIFSGIKDVAAVGNIPLLFVQRTIDSKLIELSKTKKFWNGHIPISMIYAWIGTFLCFLYDYETFVVSNEKSADEGNIFWNGMVINHQWSKSKEFEKMMQSYLQTYLTPSIQYYSALRSYTELEITKMFIQYDKYFNYVSSCNRNFSSIRPLEKGKRWCRECAKCVFSFLLFAAYLPKQKVIEMFGQDLFEKENLSLTFLDILGKGIMKPFDCVGTFTEAQAALRMIQEKKEFSGSPIMNILCSI